jgi:hypothetical protein
MIDSPWASPLTIDSYEPGEFFVRLERESCYGDCPVYTVTIFPDGRVKYNGMINVKVHGPRKDSISRHKLLELDRLFQGASFFALRDTYVRMHMTDHASATISFRRSKKLKKVVHYFGDQTAPEVLYALEEAVDKAVRINRWIGTPKERQLMQRRKMRSNAR